METEEGSFVECSVTFADPQRPDPNPPRLVRPMRPKFNKFKDAIPLNVANLVKLAKAVDPWSSSLAIYGDRNAEPYVWGILDQIVHANTFRVGEGDSAISAPGQFTILIEGPGHLSAFHDSDLLGSLRRNELSTPPLDVFHRGPINTAIERISRPLERALEKPLLTKGVVSTTLSKMSDHYLEVIRRIIIGIRRYRHGGAIIIDPKLGATGEEEDLSFKYRFEYDRFPAALIELLKLDWQATALHVDSVNMTNDKMPLRRHLSENIVNYDLDDRRDEVTGAVRLIASLSRVDGAIVLQSDLAVRGFGAEITRKTDPRIVMLAKNEAGDLAMAEPLEPKHYGTRHRSMMRYCNAHPAAIGIVVSQDGDVRMLKKHRSRLIFWDNVKTYDD